MSPVTEGSRCDLVCCLIAAIDLNGAIGYHNKLPWPHMAADLSRFKQLTTGRPMIMGKNTFHSLPNVLPNRLHIVLTNNSNDEEIHRIESNKTKNSFVITVKSISEALQCAVADVDTDEYNKHRERKVSIVGGHSVFQHMQRLCRRWHITLVHDIHNYDTRFPEITRQDSSGATHIFDLAFDLRMDREAIRRAGGRIVQQETYPNDEYNPVPYTFFTIEW